MLSMVRHSNNELQDDETKQVVVQKVFHFNAIDHYTEQKIHQILNVFFVTSGVFFSPVSSDMTDEISFEDFLEVFP